MFRKLRLQFVVTNLAIISFLLVVITASAYFSMRNNLIQHANFFASQLATNFKADALPGTPGPPAGHNPPYPFALPPKLPPKPPGRPQREPDKPIFFIRTTSGGTISFASEQQPFDRVQLRQLLNKVLKIRQANGMLRFGDITYYFSKTAASRPAGTLLVFQDMSPLGSVIQNSLTIGLVCLVLALLGSLLMARWAIAPIQKAWQQQKDFIADASHELRTPVTIIQTTLDVVLDEPQASVAAQREWLNIIGDEARRVAHLVDGLLFLARSDSNQPMVDKQIFSLSQVAADGLEAFKPSAAAQGLELAAAVTGEITALGDAVRIRQVIDILLDNAIRHTPAGGRITLRLFLQEKKIWLKIKDTGEGIAPQHVAKIFDRFYQVDGSRSKGQAGLGLSIAKSIIESHGGTIAVTSALHAGTEFTIKLPVPPVK